MSDAPGLRHTTRHARGEVLLDANFQQVLTSEVIGSGPGGAFVQRAGDSMLGALTLAGAPTANLHAANKAYVDAFQGNFVDAPFTPGVWGRSFGAWEGALPLTGGVLTGTLQLPAGSLLFPAVALGAADGTGFSRAGNLIAFSVGGTLTAAAGATGWQFYQSMNMLTNRITSLGDAINPTDALNLRTADARYVGAAPVGGWLANSGGTMTGPLALYGDPSSPLEAATMQYVDGIRAGLLPITGGTLTGPLSLPLTPTLDAHATSKTYVDQQIASQALYQGTWAVGANLPPLNPPVPPPWHGYMWIATTANPQVPEDPPAGMPGISGMGPIAHGARIIWNDILGQWDHVVTIGGLDMTAADARYLRLTGGGPITGFVQFDTGFLGFSWPSTGDFVYHGPNGLTLRRALGQPTVITETSTGTNPQPLLTPPDADARYVQLIGNSTIAGELTFQGDDVTAPLHSGLTIGAGRRCRIYYGPGGLRISRGDANEAVHLENFDGSGVSEILTHDAGDARYLTPTAGDLRYYPQTGGLLNGNLTFPSANGITFATGGIIFENNVVGMIIRRSLGQAALWTENQAGNIRTRLLDETDLRAPPVLIEPAAVTVPFATWTLLFDANYPMQQTGNRRLRISLAVNVTMTNPAQLGTMAARVSQPPSNVQRRVWSYGLPSASAGINVEFLADVVGPNPRIAVELIALEGSGFTTTAGAADNARSQVIIADLGPAAP